MTDSAVVLMMSFAEENSLGRPDEIVRRDNAIGCRWGDIRNAVAFPRWTSEQQLMDAEQALRVWDAPSRAST